MGVIHNIKLDTVIICKMQVRVVLLLVGTALVAGMPEPDPDTKVDVKVDPGDSKLDSYMDAVYNAAGVSFNLVANLFGQSDPNKGCCKVNGVTYENGDTNVPCDGKGTPPGKCVDGNVQCPKMP